MTPNERLQELYRLAVSLEKNPVTDIFDMETWFNDDSEYIEDTLNSELSVQMKEDDCKTAGCMFGSAALHKPFIDEGLYLQPREFSYSLPYVPMFQGHEGFEAAKSFFDLKGNDAEFLFDPGTYDEFAQDHAIPVSSVIKRIAMILAQKGIPVPVVTS
jgi:hypothetical protein